MALNDLVNRIKGIFSGGASSTDSRQNIGGGAAGPGHPGKPDTFSNLKNQASDLADKAQAEASKLGDKAQHAAADLQQKAGDLLDRGQEKATSTAANVPDSSGLGDNADAAANSAKANAGAAKGDLTDRVDELKTSAEAQVDEAKTEFDERRS
jgi:hypothetical protein